MPQPINEYDSGVSIELPGEGLTLQGNLSIPKEAKGLIIFAHGSGSSRFSSRNKFVADVLKQHQFATLLMDLLTPEEEVVDNETAQFRFDIPMLAQRLIGATKWVKRNKQTQSFQIGYFGASTGSAAALIAAADQGKKVCAVVSRGGRSDLRHGHIVKSYCACFIDCWR